MANMVTPPENEAGGIPRGFWTRAAAGARLSTHLGWAGVRRLVRRSDADDAELGDALFRELDRLKGMAMKVGQILSYMDVGLPEQTVARLAKLQQGAAPMPMSTVRAVVEAALGGPLEQRFDRFDVTPVAAASVGQVHRASVRGVEVAVKVRYPEVRSTIEADIGHLGAISRLAGLASAVDGPALVAELRARLVEECDYLREAAWQRAFGTAFADDPHIGIPAVVDSHCAADVLTTVWCAGSPFEAVRAWPESTRAALAASLMRFPYVSLLGHGVLQADPHPGNVLFESASRAVMLDFGCVRRFDTDTVEGFRGLSLAVVQGRRAALPAAAMAAGLAPRPERLDFDLLWAQLRWLHEPYTDAHFAFDRAYWARGLQYSRPSNPNLRHQALPPQWLWLQRMQWGLHAVLVRLGARGDFRQVLAEALALPLNPLPGPE
jgi:predicted unusual protein kinase regulating ubiquinone biosynthesis (AarF/ABC1/UbiB family)